MNTSIRPQRPEKIHLNVRGLPSLDRNYTTHFAVLGGRTINRSAAQMAFYIGQQIIDANKYLLTGGRIGVGYEASRGAYEMCLRKNIDPAQYIFSLVTEGKDADFQIGTQINIGASNLERNIALMQNTSGAFIIGGEKGTKHQILIGVIQAIMEGYAIIPVFGTGGEADRICAAIPRFKDEILNNPMPSEEKAQRIFKMLSEERPCWYCNIDLEKTHNEWFGGSTSGANSSYVPALESPLAKEMHRIRHIYW